MVALGPRLFTTRFLRKPMDFAAELAAAGLPVETITSFSSERND